jgi:hypothetical protein
LFGDATAAKNRRSHFICLASQFLFVEVLMRYRTEAEIEEVVRTFEDGTISRVAWKHAEHLTVALHYLSLYDFDVATEKMRSGIFNLLRAFEVDLTKEMPYHETMTVFWMRAVAGYNASKNGVALLDKANEMIELLNKEYPLRFYSRELLFSDKARSSFVEADIKPLEADG